MGLDTLINEEHLVRVLKIRRHLGLCIVDDYVIFVFFSIENDTHRQGVIQVKYDGGYRFWAPEFRRPNSENYV